MDETRRRILDAAAGLLAQGGADALSTRAIGAAANVQAPTIYRLFGDKRGLLDALAVHGLTAYLERKSARQPCDDPVADLREGWDEHVTFGLENPALYLLMYGDPRPGTPPPPAALEGLRILAGRIARIARAGRLRVSEQHAADLVHAAGRGTTLTLIEQPESVRDPGLSDLARESIIAAITTDERPPAEPGVVTAAVALRAALAETNALTDSEQALLRDWLDRITTRGR